MKNLTHNNWIDLTYKIDEITLNFRGLPGCQFETIWDYHNCTTETKFKVHKLHISAGLGTHIDSPMHCFENGISAAEIINQPQYNGLIIDFENFCIKEGNLMITKEIFKEKLEGLNIHCIENFFIVFKTGWGRFWGEEKYHNNYVFPYLSEDLGIFLRDNKVAGIGIDTLSPDLVTPEGKYILHEILLSKNIFIAENIANLDDLGDTKGTFLLSPLKIVSSEAPMRVFFREGE